MHLNLQTWTSFRRISDDQLKVNDNMEIVEGLNLRKSFTVFSSELIQKLVITNNWSNMPANFIHRFLSDSKIRGTAANNVTE